MRTGLRLPVTRICSTGRCDGEGLGWFLSIRGRIYDEYPQVAREKLLWDFAEGQGDCEKMDSRGRLRGHKPSRE